MSAHLKTYSSVFYFWFQGELFCDWEWCYLYPFPSSTVIVPLYIWMLVWVIHVRTLTYSSLQPTLHTFNLIYIWIDIEHVTVPRMVRYTSANIQYLYTLEICSEFPFSLFHNPHYQFVRPKLTTKLTRGSLGKGLFSQETRTWWYHMTEIISKQGLHSRRILVVLF